VGALDDPTVADRLGTTTLTAVRDELAPGRLEAGMTVVNARTGGRVRLQAPRQFLARDRQVVDGAWAGDVVGVHDKGDLQVGDTVSADGTLVYERIPRSPGRTVLYDRLDRPVLLFDNEWSLRAAAGAEPDVKLLEVEP